jgi:hypothetical protein
MERPGAYQPRDCMMSFDVSKYRFASTVCIAVMDWINQEPAFTAFVVPPGRPMPSYQKASAMAYNAYGTAASLIQLQVPRILPSRCF